MIISGRIAYFWFIEIVLTSCHTSSVASGTVFAPLPFRHASVSACFQFSLAALHSMTVGCCHSNCFANLLKVRQIPHLTIPGVAPEQPWWRHPEGCSRGNWLASCRPPSKPIWRLKAFCEDSQNFWCLQPTLLVLFDFFEEARQWSVCFGSLSLRAGGKEANLLLSLSCKNLPSIETRRHYLHHRSVICDWASWGSEWIEAYLFQFMYSLSINRVGRVLSVAPSSTVALLLSAVHVRKLKALYKM